MLWLIAAVAKLELGAVTSKIIYSWVGMRKS